MGHSASGVLLFVLVNTNFSIMFYHYLRNHGRQMVAVMFLVVLVLTLVLMFGRILFVESPAATDGQRTLDINPNNDRSSFAFKSGANAYSSWYDIIYTLGRSLPPVCHNPHPPPFSFLFHARTDYSSSYDSPNPELLLPTTSTIIQDFSV